MVWEGRPESGSIWPLPKANELRVCRGSFMSFWLSNKAGHNGWGVELIMRDGGCQ